MGKIQDNPGHFREDKDREDLSAAFLIARKKTGYFFKKQPVFYAQRLGKTFDMDFEDRSVIASEARQSL